MHAGRGDRPLKKHHAEALDKARERLLEQVPDLLAIILGGSIAKGIERETSDVDLIVVITDEAYRKRLHDHVAGFYWPDLCDWEGGYVEGRFISRTFLEEAAVRGSEPTRHSFKGTRPVICRDPAIAELLPQIPVYPIKEQAEKIASFYAQIKLNYWYFFKEGARRNDPYLRTRAATDLVLFGYRLVLAHNRELYACQRRLKEQVEAVPDKPDGLIEKAERLLTELSDKAMEDFCAMIEDFADWGEPDCLDRFLQDVEMSWFNRKHAISEW
jgi:hypothetical protein